MGVPCTDVHGPETISTLGDCVFFSTLMCLTLTLCSPFHILIFPVHLKNATIYFVCPSLEFSSDISEISLKVVTWLFYKQLLYHHRELPGHLSLVACIFFINVTLNFFIFSGVLAPFRLFGNLINDFIHHLCIVVFPCPKNYITTTLLYQKQKLMGPE